MYKYFFAIAIKILLWHMCLSLHECNRTINGTEMSFTCPSIVGSQELRLYDLTVAQLNSITSLIVTGNENIVGPFTRIPANICLLRNLQKIDFSYNQIIEADPTGSLTQCLTKVVTLNLTSNNISNFPSFMIYNMPSLKNLYFQDNLLTEIPVNAFTDVSSLEIIDFSYNNLTTFELWALEVKTKADFSYNQISTITNKYFFKKILNRTIEQGVYLSNNSAAINFTDAVYEMYNQCEEVYQWYFSNMDLPMQPWFTWKLAYIDFGTTRIDCSCDQAYFLRVFKDSSFLEGQIYPIQNAMCSNNSLGVNDTTLWNSSCASPIFETNSTVDFSQVYPKLCKITEDEGGELTNVTDIDPPTLNASFYPNYTTASLNPGACYFSFSNSTSMMIRCTNDTSNSASRIPTDLLSSPYMSNITHITFSSSISSLPSYVCSLPSGEIDLSFQAFTTLNDTTFPCLDSFRTINLSFNQLTSVNMKNGNLKNLTSLDLSSNKLTSLPYSILDPTPTSLRYLDLRNNSINYLDLFIFTLKNITINLDNNPINSSNIINPQNVTLGNNDTSTVNITFPATVKNSTIPITDEIALTYGICQNFQSLRNNLLKLQSTVSHVVLVCTCVSINLKQIYQQNGYNITNDFQCSTAGDEETFYALNMTSCSNVTDFKSGLCAEPPPTTVAPPLQSNNNDSNSSRTALIIGLVVGLGCSLLLVVAILVVIYIVKAKGAVSGVTKRVDRAPVTNQAPEDSLQSRVQSRSFRSVKLAPIIHKSAPLPATPVAAVIPTTASTTASHTNTKLRSSSKGISLRLDSIRSPSNVNPQYPPNSNALNNTSSFRPIDKLSLHPPSIPEQEYQVPKPQKPRTHPMLNAGGDTRY